MEVRELSGLLGSELGVWIVSADSEYNMIGRRSASVQRASGPRGRYPIVPTEGRTCGGSRG
jgi:hypothetical protein